MSSGSARRRRTCMSAVGRQKTVSTIPRSSSARRDRRNFPFPLGEREERVERGSHEDAANVLVRHTRNNSKRKYTTMKHAETHPIHPKDHPRIRCHGHRWRDCDAAPATIAEHVHWDTGTTKGVSFFYYCAPCYAVLAAHREKRHHV